MRPIEVVIYRDGKHWVAQALNMEVSSFGESAEDARESIREALELYFEDDRAVEVSEVRDA
jgi:predicted RNase H-like HicB family nuclease